MMCPECASLGTVTSRPPEAVRRREAGETLLTCAPGFCGNATVIPACRPGPCSSNVPWVETWWGLPLQRLTGTQLTWVIFTLVTCSDVDAGLVGAVALAGVEEPGADVPPGLAAWAAGVAARQRAH